jgi:acrosin
MSVSFDGPLHTLGVEGGSGGNTFNVLDTSVTGTSSGTEIIPSLGTSANIINVQATTGALVVIGEGETDTVNVGSNGSVQGIKGVVNVQNRGQFTTLNVDDHLDHVGRVVTIDGELLGGRITGLAPAAIAYPDDSIRSVVVSGGDGGNTFNFQDTATFGNPTWTINAGGGTAIVNVLGTTAALNIDTQFANATVNVGNAGNARGILGALSVTSSKKAYHLEVNDSADTTGRNVTLTGSIILGLTPAPITYGGVSPSIQLDGSAGGDTFNVQGMPQALRVNGGAGNDTMNVGSFNSLNGLVGNLQFAGGGGADTLNVNDQGTRTPQTYTIQANSVKRDSGPLVIGYDASTTKLTVNGGSGGNIFNVLGTSTTAATTLDTGFGNNTVNVQSTTGALTVNGQGGQDAVNVGQGGSAQGIKGALSITGTGSHTKLSVDDHLDHTGRVVTMDVANGTGTITGLAPATIMYTEAGVHSVSVSGGDGGNTFNVQNTAGIGNATTTINSGAGKNFVNVHRTTGALAVNGHDGADVIDVGQGGSVQSIKGALTVTNTAASSTLAVDNSADTINRTVGLGVTSGNGSITGLAPATITYAANAVNQVQVLGGNGSNLYLIGDTVSNSSSPTTIIRGGIKNDTFALFGNTGALQIDGGGGSDVINVGGGSNGAGNVKGTLTLADTGGKIQLQVFDGLDSANRQVQVTDHSVIGLPGQILFNPTQLTSATLHTGTGTDTIFVQSTPAGVPITIDTGSGKSTINVGSVANTLDGILGALTINGGVGGTNTLNINDQGSTTPHVYTQTATTLSRAGAATITFTGIQSLNVNKGAVVGSPPQVKHLKLTQPVKGSGLVVLTGQLTDIDRDAKLTLTVDWADGSGPQSIVPGQSPFKLTHNYASKGEYTVRVIWTDLETRQSNSRDLTIRI